VAITHRPSSPAQGAPTKRCTDAPKDGFSSSSLRHFFVASPQWDNVNSAAPYFRDNSRCAQPTFKGFNPTL